MKWCRYLLVPLAVMTLTSPSWPGIPFFSKHAKPNPAERVPELLNTIKTSQDERNRSSAVEELRQYDPATFPQMIPVLLEILAKDAKPGVRSEAADTLSKLRPVSQQVGKALEQAQSQDPSMRVRMQARYSLLHYHWSGYRSAKKNEPPGLETNEPPLAAPPVITTTQPGPRLTSSTSMKQASEGPQLVPPSSKPAPRGRAKPADAAKPKAPPAPDEGPSLMPPP
jgi:hypothetical protein